MGVVIEDLIWGFMERMYNSMDLTHSVQMASRIPSICITLILSFYDVEDDFSLPSKNSVFRLVNSGKSIMCSCSFWNSVYGNILIHSNSVSPSHFQWTVRVQGPKDEPFDCVIGIASDTSQQVFHHNEEHANFGWSNNGYTYCSYNQNVVNREFDNGDKITIDLNLRKKCLRFFKNGVDQHIGYTTEIENAKNIKYCLAISTSTEQLKFTVIESKFIAILCPM
eukprot:369305_1